MLLVLIYSATAKFDGTSLPVSGSYCNGAGVSVETVHKYKSYVGGTQTFGQDHFDSKEFCSALKHFLGMDSDFEPVDGFNPDEHTPEEQNHPTMEDPTTDEPDIIEPDDIDVYDNPDDSDQDNDLDDDDFDESDDDANVFDDANLDF